MEMVTMKRWGKQYTLYGGGEVRVQPSRNLIAILDEEMELDDAGLVAEFRRFLRRIEKPAPMSPAEKKENALYKKGYEFMGERLVEAGFLSMAEAGKVLTGWAVQRVWALPKPNGSLKYVHVTLKDFTVKTEAEAYLTSLQQNGGTR